MKTVTILALLPMASAFVAPMPKMARGRAIRMAFDAEPGAVKFPPANTGYWDPLGFSKDGDQEKFNNFRAIEIKHGRLAMIAMAHYLITYSYKLPGYFGDVKIADIPSGLGGIKALPIAGWIQILLFASALEFLAPQQEDRIPGDLQPDTEVFAKTEGKTPEEFADYQTKEINNGRLAMVAIAGSWASELLTGGQHPIDTLLAKLQ